MEFPETASPDISEVGGPHHVAKNFGNTLWYKFRQHFQKLNFFPRFSAKIDIFDFSVWQGRGCAWSEISFWRDPHRLGVKPHGRPKSRTRPPRGVTNIFSSPSIDFGWNFIIKAWKRLILTKLQKFVTLRIIHGIFWNRVSGHFGVGGSPLCCQKFRQQLKPKIPATLSELKFFSDVIPIDLK